MTRPTTERLAEIRAWLSRQDDAQAPFPWREHVRDLLAEIDVLRERCDRLEEVIQMRPLDEIDALQPTPGQPTITIEETDIPGSFFTQRVEIKLTDEGTVVTARAVGTIGTATAVALVNLVEAYATTPTNPMYAGVRAACEAVRKALGHDDERQLQILAEAEKAIVAAREQS